MISGSASPAVDEAVLVGSMTAPAGDAGAATDGASDAAPGAGAAYEVVKRGLDVAGAAGLLALALPVIAVIAAAVRATSPGPVLFRQARLGRGGRPFSCLKFRTMVRDAEHRLSSSQELSAEFVANYKIKNDPRVTPVGAFLRRTSLDELPQLWNVLVGDMSLIGPRPIVPPELVKYGAEGPKLLTVKPGLGGMWQVNGRSDTTYDERVAMDIAYVETRSLALDLSLMARTLLVVLRGRGAY